jgi:hypothetical protein
VQEDEAAQVATATGCSPKAAGSKPSTSSVQGARSNPARRAAGGSGPGGHAGSGTTWEPRWRQTL